MPLWLNKRLALTEQEIRYAMENSSSNADAARFLGCHNNTYARYAKRYIDKNTGLSLFDIHKLNNKKRVKTSGAGSFVKTDIFEIIEGKHPTYSSRKFKERLFAEGIIEEKCQQCGFDERRITDYKVPLMLGFIDNNKQNFSLDNLEILCYNCFFLTHGNINHKHFII